MKALALTDRNGGYGLVEFYKLATRMGIKPILGAELDDRERQQAVILARDRERYAQLCRLISERRLNPGFSLTEALRETSEGIIILSSSLTLLQELSLHRRKGLFAELVLTREAKSRAHFQKVYNLATGLGIPLVATNDVHFLSPQDHIIHRLLRAIGERKTITTVGNLVSPECYLKSDHQMRELFRDLPQGLKNTGRIADACQVDLKLGEWKYPAFPLPPTKNPHRYLSWLSWQGLRRRYHSPSPEAMREVKERFLRSCHGQGLDPEVTRKIWEQMKSFAGYAFCKAHSASFAQLSFRVAWLKAHYPARFMAAVLSNGGGFYSPGAYIQEAKRMGLKVLLPDVNRSQTSYTGRGDKIRIGLMAIKNLSQRSADSLLEARQARSFISLTDLIKRTTLGLKELETLIRCGALDGFGPTRPELLWQLLLSPG